MTKLWLHVLHCAKIALYLLLTNLAASATAQQSAENDEEIEEVIVTGSHIKSTPADAPLPVTSVTREELTLAGSPSTLDMIKQLSFSQGADGETDQFQAGAGADRATINIRGLGPSRSLVLLNGQRTTWSPHAIGAQAQLLVDVNALPTIALERVEILRDGAAATYGSDAIAGVMNYITRSDFEGMEFSFNHKMIDGNDGDSEIGFIFGDDVLDGRGQIVTSFSYISRTELPLIERDWAVRDYDDSPLGGWSSIGRPAVFVPYDRYDRTSGGFTGLLIAGVVDPSCETLGAKITTAGIAGNTLGGFCRFQYTAFDNLAEEAERWQWFTEYSMDLDDSTVLSINFLHSNSEVPAPKTSPSYPPNRLVDRGRSIRANNPGLVDMARQFSNDPAYGPIYSAYAWCGEAYCGYEGDPWDEVAWVYGRSYGQDGPLRSHARENSLDRLFGEIAGKRDNYDWQITVGWSSSNRISLGGDTMVYRDERGREGLAGHECEATVPNEYDANGNLSFSLETLQQHAGKGSCSYWIPFSNGMRGSHPQVRNGVANNPTYNPELDNADIYDYMITNLGGEGDTSLFLLEGLISGTITSFSAFDINYAVGVQLRSESYESGVLSGGLNDGVEYPCQAGPEIKNCTTGHTGLFGFLPPGFPIDETRSIQSIFSEFSAPVNDNLEVNFSLRYENYGSDTGSSLDPKLAVRWQILDSLSLRTSVGTTFRGPTLNQVVSENSSNSLQFVGVTGAFKRIDTKGNPALDPETARTINVGLIFDQDMFNGNFFATADYWSYDFSKPLVTEPFNNILALACPGAVTAPCDTSSLYFDRIQFGGDAVAANVEIIDINIINGPDIKTDGIDYAATLELPLGDGLFRTGLSATNILSYDISRWELGTALDALGRLNYNTSLARTLVEWKGKLFLNYSFSNLNLRTTIHYIDEYVHNIEGTDIPIEKQITYDLNANWQTPVDNLGVWGAILNATDEDPPFMRREMNYDAFTHNPFGRIVKFGLTYSM